MLNKQIFGKAYATQHAAQKLDLYTPTVQLGVPWPAVIYIHGGGWRVGGRAISIDLAPYALRAAGVALVSIDFRDSDHGPWPLHIKDVKTAIRWVRANAATYGIDPNRLGLWGSSSGAHMALIAGLTPGVASLRDPAGGNSTVSEAVSAVVSWFAPCDARSIDSDFVVQVAEGGPASSRGLVCGNLGCPEAQMLGGVANPIDPCTAADALYHPTTVTHWIANATAAPAWRIEHGVALSGVGGDSQIPINQARRMRDALFAQYPSASFAYNELSGAPHGIDAPQWKAAPVRDAVVDWLSAHL